MKLITQRQYAKLLDNGHRQNDARQRGDSYDFYPVVKLFTPDAEFTWLLTEINPDNQSIAFGLVDLGFGFPELDTIVLSWLQLSLGKIEQDRHFDADRPLSKYHEEARKNGFIQ